MTLHTNHTLEYLMRRSTVPALAVSTFVLAAASGCASSDGGSAKDASATTATSIGAQKGDRIDASSITLRSASDAPVPMKMLLEDGPVVLVFYRGSWCPYCEKALEGWDDSLDELNAMGGRLIALTPDAPNHVSEMLTEHDLGFTVLSDADAQAAKALRINFLVDAETRRRYLGYGINLEESNASGLWQLPHPGTFILSQDGTVLYANTSADYRNGRADPDEVIAAYRDVARGR